MIPVILSGGVGSRLWPMSRGMYPKQLLPLASEQWSMLQQTVQRAQNIPQIGSPIIVCNDEHRFMVGEQLHQLGVSDSTIILEPQGRNTAPAIALAAIQALSSGDPKAILLVMPADHVVADHKTFADRVAIAVKLAAQGLLVTFGILPTGAETGYGYIKAGEPVDGAYKVAEFKEKPTSAIAEQYVASGDYYWNGGIFVLQASTYLEQLAHFAPDVLAAAQQAMQHAKPDLDFIRADAACFSKSPSISIDYAVMEKTGRAMVVPLDVGWNDIGSWSALWEVSPKDANGNAIRGDVLLHNTKNSHIYAETKLVSAIGVTDLVIVETDDAVMVTTRDQCQDVKKIVEQLKTQKRSQVTHHRKVYRPWGWYDSIDAGEGFQVKRILVKPGGKLSVQMHNHRAEHWVVVKGVAEVLNGEETKLLKENESTYIPIGVTHALRNLSTSDTLEIIEVQSGSYLGEDDIVRFEDEYGRVD